MDDEEFVRCFENCTLRFEQWTHRSHVRIAYLYLRQFAFDQALGRIRSGIKRYNATHQVPEGPTSGYNETTTQAFLQLVAVTIQTYSDAFPTPDSDSFCDAHPQLMTKHALRFFYSPARRMNPLGKTQFIEPDLAPLPTVPIKPVPYERRMPKLTIYPYFFEGTCWVFDDQRTGLKEEAFVLGMTEMISKVVEAKAIPNAAKGFALTFGVEQFDHDVELTWLSPTEAVEARGGQRAGLPGIGNWYRGIVCGEEMVGWLCPALFLYFSEAPKKIFANAEPLPEGIDPIWHVDANDSIARRFVSPTGEFQD